MGKFKEGIVWTYPTGVNGAASSTHLRDNGGTAPTFSTEVYRYILHRGVGCSLYIRMAGNTATDGSGAVDAELTMPFRLSPLNGTDFYAGSGLVIRPAATTGVIFQPQNGDEIMVIVDTTDGSSLQNADFSDGSREIHCQLNYSRINAPN
jgi:hypothetical protein